MLNAEFKLLCESLGFYNARSVQQYLNRFPEHATLNERPVQTWLNGKNSVQSAFQKILWPLF